MKNGVELKVDLIGMVKKYSLTQILHTDLGHDLEKIEIIVDP